MKKKKWMKSAPCEECGTIRREGWPSFDHKTTCSYHSDYKMVPCEECGVVPLSGFPSFNHRPSCSQHPKKDAFKKIRQNGFSREKKKADRAMASNAVQFGLNGWKDRID